MYFICLSLLLWISLHRAKLFIFVSYIHWRTPVYGFLGIPINTNIKTNTISTTTSRVQHSCLFVSSNLKTGNILWSCSATETKHVAFNMNFKSQVTKICDNTMPVQSTLLAVLVYFVWAERENSISYSERQQTGISQHCIKCTYMHTNVFGVLNKLH